MNADRPWALILAGGDGTRLQGLTQAISGCPMPKQYCRLYGSRTLLEATLARAGRFATSDHIAAIVNQDHLEFCAQQVRALPLANLVWQPCNRDTGPGIVLALLHLMQRAPQAVVAMLPSDHFVDDDAAFVAHLERARAVVAAAPDAVTLLGIVPDAPDPGLGYITLAGESRTAAGAFAVAAFHEKPDSATAARLIRDGALWNSFAMVFRVARMLELLEHEVPEEVERVRRACACPRAMAREYARLPAWNFSHRFLSQIASQLAVVRADGLFWSDWGTPAAIARTFARLNQTPPWPLGS